MIKQITTLLLLTFCLTSTAQEIKKQVKWQQRVDYSIDVELDDLRHLLDGKLKMVYTNNSPKDLNQIYFHLWPNAYKNNTTDFARQQLINGKTDFYFASEDDRGFMDQLDFKVDGKNATWNALPGQPDICIVSLPKTLKSGGSILIETPFRVKIPADFSRCGHVNQDYQITQWYPKPAVYDVNGWNPMAYLNQGEFYSEFGSFDVRISVPENYIVAATGVLQEKSEWEFIRERRDNPLETFSGIVSTSQMKTLTFKVDNVHDFAWFTSKYYNVEENEVTLSNGEVVGTFVYAPEKKLNSTKDIATALTYYSDHCGMYPYKYCSVVQGPITAGGGMEYPMITVVADLGKEVIVHEVGHNWFYGILGSNERSYPWMDESINTYFESLAINGSSGYSSDLSKPTLKMDRINDEAMGILSRSADRTRMHQPVGLNSKYFTNMNYGIMVYGKGSLMMGHLHMYLGDDVFFDCFRKYYELWSFKHPLPDNMKRVFEQVSGANLSWFFDDMINSDKMLDYKVKSTSTGKVTVVNAGGIAAPYPIGYYKNGEMQLEVWQPGHLGSLEIGTPAIEFDLIKIDPFEVMTESNRRNNTIRTSGAFRTVEPIQTGLYGGLENPNNSQIYLGPVLGWNRYNKLMIGAVVSNAQIPPTNFVYTIMPMYSTETEDVNGYANFAYRWFMDKKLNKVELGAKNARFAYQPFESYTYNRIAPYLKFNFRNADKRYRNQTEFTLRYTNTSVSPQFDEAAAIGELAQDTNSWGRRTVIENSPDQFVDATIEYQDNKALNPFGYRINLQYGMVSDQIHKADSISGVVNPTSQDDNFIRLSITLNKRISYSLKKKGLDIRVFFGTYLDEPTDGLYQYRIGSQSGRYDYTFEHTVMGRNANDGMYQRQVLPSDMGMKQIGNFGNILGWTASANFRSNIPGKLPLSLYMDLFTYKDIGQAANNDDEEQIGYNGGLVVHIVPEIFEIYVPFLNSSFITKTQEVQGINSFGQRVTFMLNLNKIGNLNLSELLNNAF